MMISAIPPTGCKQRKNLVDATNMLNDLRKGDSLGFRLRAHELLFCKPRPFLQRFILVSLACILPFPCVLKSLHKFERTSTIP